MALVYAACCSSSSRATSACWPKKERERAAQEERIRHQAYHDALTGLPNRASFTEHLEEAMRRAKRAGWPLAMLFLDLDLFKRVNDSLGHDAGDRLLRVAAERIRRAVREADMLFRMGGDEFTVLLEDVRGPEEAATVAGRVLEAIAEPLQLEHHEISVTASIGIALYPRDDVLGERLVKSADTAMYRAKELGRNRYEFFARGDERARREPDHDRGRAAPRAEERRVRAALPAARVGGDRPRHRRGGAAALEPSRSGAWSSRRASCRCSRRPA